MPDTYIKKHSFLLFGTVLHVQSNALNNSLQKFPSHIQGCFTVALIDNLHKTVRSRRHPAVTLP